MIGRRRSTQLILATVILAVGCGTAAPATTAPGTPAATAPAASSPVSTPGTASPTAAPTQAPAPSAAPTPEPTDAVASPAPDDLASLIPTEAGAYTIQAQAVPPDLIASYMTGIEQLLTDVGATPADASLVLAGATGSGITDSAVIYALRVAGADSAALAQAEVERWLAQMVEGSEATQVTIGGKNVLQVGEQDPSFPKYAKYVYAVGDVVFVIDQAGNDTVIEEVLSALP